VAASPDAGPLAGRRPSAAPIVADLRIFVEDDLVRLLDDDPLELVGIRGNQDVKEAVPDFFPAACEDQDQVECAVE